MKAVNRGVAAHVKDVRGPIGLAIRLWQAISEPRHLQVTYLAIYALTVCVGVVTLMWPPRTIEGPLGEAATMLWAAAFIGGGLVGAIAVLPGWWWLERLLGIGLILVGLGVYLAVAIALHIDGAAEGSSRLTQIGVILLASSPFTIRFLLIWEYSYEPRRG